MITLTLRAVCLSKDCGYYYEAQYPGYQHKKDRSERANRELWMQTHLDMHGHPRFEVSEYRRSVRIVSRPDNAQLSLTDDENYSTTPLRAPDERG